MPTKERSKIEIEHLIITRIIPETLKGLKDTMYWDDIRGATSIQMSKHGARLYPFVVLARKIAVHGTDYGEVLDTAVISIVRGGHDRTIIAIHHHTGVKLFLNVDNGNGYIVSDISTITENHIAHRPPVVFCGFWNQLMTRAYTVNTWVVETAHETSLWRALTSYWKWRN